MKHRLKISVSKKPQSNGLLAFRTVTVREKFLNWLLGAPNKVTILVPGSSVDAISISEIADGGVS